ncbi:MAG: tripartite tricarboxylate transporter substrate binding protein [Alphaproteobacteria bacterium]|nr:tripartite tricarboxylate transporter substrate binding protein [Alphaproteobacteria bacterium]
MAIRILVSLLLLAGTAAAQDYPARPIKMIVPFAAGGAADLMGRVVAQKLSEALPQQVVVENRGGAGGNIGADLVAKAAPDGYTLLMGNAPTLAINASLFSKLPYDPAKDFSPVSLVAAVPLLLLVNPAQPMQSVQDVIAAARAKPGGLVYASGGNGSTTHLSMELLKSMTKTDILPIPFNGSAPAIVASGEVPLMMDLIPSSIAQVTAGRLRALAISTAQRSALLPNLPTIAESGVPGFEVSSWFGVVAPAGTPAPIVERLNHEIVRALQMADTRERLAALGADPIGTSAADFAAYIKSELVKWAAVVKTSGAHVE